MNVVVIGAGMLAPKKSLTADRLEQRYLNFGALSLASRLSGAQMLQASTGSPEALLNRFSDQLDAADLLLVSLPSFHAVDWATELLGLWAPPCRVVVGGRWVVDGNVPWLKGLFPPGVEFHEGPGESWLNANLGRLLEERAEWSSLPVLDYSRLYDRYEFHGSVEVSRGCGMGCSFCADGDTVLTRMKDPLSVVQELMTSQAVLGPSANFYLEASFFAPTRNWVSAFQSAYREHECVSEWRTETRADALDGRKIDGLAEAGLRVLDIGLESASPRQLLSMGKTKDPESYLSRASRTLRNCRAAGVLPKVNIMLYAGESETTLLETERWLDEHAEYIKGVSVYPVHLYGLGSCVLEGYQHLLSRGAGSLVPTGTPGVVGVDLSDQMSYVDSVHRSEELSRRYMTADDYYSLKAFSYFRRGYERQDFMKGLDRGRARYPFRF